MIQSKHNSITSGWQQDDGNNYVWSTDSKAIPEQWSVSRRHEGQTYLRRQAQDAEISQVSDQIKQGH